MRVCEPVCPPATKFVIKFVTLCPPVSRVINRASFLCLDGSLRGCSAKIIDNNAWYWKGKLISPSKKSLEASLMTGTVPVEKALDQDYVDKRLQELKEELERKERVR